MSTLVLFSDKDFLIKEISKSSTFNEIKIIKDKSELYDLDAINNLVFIYHLNTYEDYHEILEIVKELSISSRFIALRDNTNNIEGCSLLKQGFKAYAHSLSNILILEDIIKTVLNDNIWVYPELMQFLISSIPLKDSKKDALLKQITVKELEVLELVSQGLSNSEISKTLDLAEVTIKKYVSSLLKKLHKKDRLSLALYFKNNY